MDAAAALHPVALSAADEAVAARASGKAFRRITWFLVLCYIVAYLDRINIGFANLTMAADLGLSITMFGIANSVFYVAYVLFDVPSNLALARYGAKLWIPRIMITWGLASCLTMFATGTLSLFAARFLVGAAEAGLMAGAVLYLSYWFTDKDRARANGWFFMGIPVASMLGAPISGMLLQLDGVAGLHGWQWLFLLEGLPSILLGIACYFYLDDGPHKAKWLTPEERRCLAGAITVERAKVGEAGQTKFRWADLLNLRVILLTVAYFTNVANNNTTGVWTPLVVKEALGDTQQYVLIGFVSAIPPLCAAIMVPLWSWSSDRLRERTLHLAGALGITVLGWILVTIAPNAQVKLLGLTFATVGGWTFVPIFWALAVPYLPHASRPAAIATITMIGACASIVTPGIIGFLRDFTQSYNAGFWYVAALNIGGIFALLATVRLGAKPAAG